jgi:hypothetical protein
MTTDPIDSANPSTTYNLPSSPSTASYISTSGEKATTCSSIFEKLGNGTYRESIITANDAMCTTQNSKNQNSMGNPMGKTPLYWTPEVLSINSSASHHLTASISDYKLTGDETVLKRLEKRSFHNEEKIQQMLKVSVREYNKYLIIAKKQELLNEHPENDKLFKPHQNRLNGEYIYLKLQIREIQIVKLKLISKMFDFYHHVLIESYKRYEDPYNTQGELKICEEELNMLFNQFYDYLLQIEYLEREENKMIYLLQNNKDMKITQDGYLKYCWDKVRIRSWI